MADSLKIDFSLLLHLCTFKAEMSVLFSKKMGKVKLWMNPPNFRVHFRIYCLSSPFPRQRYDNHNKGTSHMHAILHINYEESGKKFISTIDALKSMGICYK